MNIFFNSLSFPKTRKLLAIGVLMSGYVGGAFAADPAVATPSAATGGYGVLSVFMLLLLALGLGAVAWLLKRNAGLPGSGNVLMRVVAAQPLGQRERVLLVKVGERFFLLGHTASQISMLTELRAEDVPAPAPMRLPENVFADLLAKIRK